MRINTNKTAIRKILNNSSFIQNIYPSKEELFKVLISGKRLVVYHGVDPTAPSLHLGHTTNYFLLEEFRKLGHKVILLIGDFTAQIGDPTGKDKTRKSLTRKEVLENCHNYKKQIGKILDFSTKNNPALLEFNSKWLSKMTLKDVIDLTSKITVQRMIERDMFQKRIKMGRPIWIHEFLYPLLQGYDSVAMNVDIEIGGNDQTFNMLIGRELMKIYRKKEKFVITTPLLIDQKTNKKLMSKSEGNFIGLDLSPEEMYGKIMSLSDETIVPILEHCTPLSQKEIQEIKKQFPRDQKARLAKEIVTIYHGKTAAQKAQENFDRVFRRKELPSKIKKVSVKEKKMFLLDLLVSTGLASSKSEAKRLVLQKGVKINSQVEEDWKKEIEIKKGMIIQVGKRKFVQLRKRFKKNGS
ncbi:tyrosine--tRNA ligase [bacterium]|nr:tyrosine--tRNA ligase [bacterium]